MSWIAIGKWACTKEFRKYNCGMAKKMGRPPRDPMGQASAIYPVRLTDAERLEFERAAKRAGLTVSGWIRERLSKAAKRESKRD